MNPALYRQMSTLGFFTSSTIQKNRLPRALPQMNASPLCFRHPTQAPATGAPGICGRGIVGVPFIEECLYHAPEPIRSAAFQLLHALQYAALFLLLRRFRNQTRGVLQVVAHAQARRFRIPLAYRRQNPAV